MTIVDELVDNWINGNLSTVIDEFEAMTGLQAAVNAVAFANRLHINGDSPSTFMSMIVERMPC